MSASKTQTPLRQIRAVFDTDTIVVYQAYSTDIASAAVAAQRLDASPLFKHSRMTWIKPSWCWMLYRAGYGFKDVGQACILALTLTRDGFEEMLRAAELSHAPEKGSGRATEDTKGTPEAAEARKFTTGSVRVQWDPERGPRLQRYEHRSIQIGVPHGLVAKMVKEWIVRIEDVTEKAHALKAAVDGNDKIGVEELKERGLMPVEKVYPVAEDIALTLSMNA